MLTIFGEIAEFECEYILQRQGEGIAVAKQNVKYIGRKKIETDENMFRDVYASWKYGEIIARAALSRLGLGKNTFYRRVKEYEACLKG